MPGGPASKAASIPAAIAAPDPLHVDVGIMRIPQRNAPHRQENAILAAFVHQMMAVGIALRKGCHVPGMQRRAPSLLDQHRLAAQHDDELVLILMPVPLGGCRAGRSEERRVGKECVSTCRSRWWP